MNFGPVQPLGDLRTIIGQRGRVGVALDAGVVLDLLDLLDHLVEGRGHRLMHLLRLVSLDEVRRPAVADEQAASSSSWVMRARTVGLEIL